MIIIPKSSPSAQNRFIYYPDHLVKLPGPDSSIWTKIWTYFAEPIFRGGLVMGILKETVVQTRPENIEDESIGHFLERRFGTAKLGDNIASAMLHGIYGGDIHQLSARSLLTSMWTLEKQYGSIRAGFRARKKENQEAAIQRLRTSGAGFPAAPSSIANYGTQAEISSAVGMLRNISPELRKVLDASVYTFKEGISALPEALEASMRADPRVDIKLGCAVTGTDYDGASGQISVCSFPFPFPDPFPNLTLTPPSSATPSTCPPQSSPTSSPLSQPRSSHASPPPPPQTLPPAFPPSQPNTPSPSWS